MIERSLSRASVVAAPLIAASLTVIGLIVPTRSDDCNGFRCAR